MRCSASILYKFLHYKFYKADDDVGENGDDCDDDDDDDDILLL